MSTEEPTSAPVRSRTSGGAGGTGGAVAAGVAAVTLLAAGAALLPGDAVAGLRDVVLAAGPFEGIGAALDAATTLATETSLGWQSAAVHTLGSTLAAVLGGRFWALLS